MLRKKPKLSKEVKRELAKTDSSDKGALVTIATQILADNGLTSQGEPRKGPARRRLSKVMAIRRYRRQLLAA